MALRSQVPKFGNWENEEDVPYTAYFEKAKKVRNAKTNPQIPANKESSFQAQEVVEIKRGDSTESEPERRKTESGSTTKEESRLRHEEDDPRKSSGFLTHRKRTSKQSIGSDRSFDNSPMNPHPPARAGNRGNSDYSSERKVSSEGTHAPASSTPGRSRLKQVTRGDETPNDDGTAIPKFGGWDERDPASAEGYTHIFNKAREDRHNGGGKSPMVSTDNADFYGQSQHGNDNTKGCGCFPWSKN